MTKLATFTEAELRRAIKAADAQGKTLRVVRKDEAQNLSLSLE